MTAGRHDLVIERGARFSRTFRFRDSEGELIDLAGRVARFTIRAPDVNGAIVLDLNSADSPEKLELGDEGEWIVDLGALQTAADVPEDGVCNGWYTLKDWPEGDEDDATRRVEGFIRWSPESTRDDESGA